MYFRNYRLRIKFFLFYLKSSKQKGVRYKLVLRPATISCAYKLKTKLFIVLRNSIQVPRYPQKLALVVAGFAVPALNMILMQCLVKSINH